MFKRLNKLKFDKYKPVNHVVQVVLFFKCIARTYKVFIIETKADVFRYGAHSREAKIQSSVVINFSEAIRVDLPIKPTIIQENVVLSAKR